MDLISDPVDLKPAGTTVLNGSVVLALFRMFAAAVRVEGDADSETANSVSGECQPSDLMCDVALTLPCVPPVIVGDCGV